MPAVDVNNMKVADLKRELRVRGLSIAGNKNELQERLQAAMEGEPLLEDSSIAGEDILDEEGVLSDEEKILGSDENELLKSPTTTPTTILANAPNSENKDVTIEDDILESPTTVTKKVVLKRKSSFNSGAALEISNTAKENTEPSLDKAVKRSEHNLITMVEKEKIGSEEAAGTPVAKKLKELSMQERLELRAKKFGIDAKTAATGTVMTAKEKNAAISEAPVVSSEKQVELLKKRAERFGCVTSSNLVKLDAEERLLKRKQRFGGTANTSTSAAGTDSNNPSSAAVKLPPGGNDEWAEKARKRLERFKANSTPTVTVAPTTKPETKPTTLAGNPTST